MVLLCFAMIFIGCLCLAFSVKGFITNAVELNINGKTAFWPAVYAFTIGLDFLIISILYLALKG